MPFMISAREIWLSSCVFEQACKQQMYMGRHHDERMHVDFSAIFKETMFKNQSFSPLLEDMKSSRVLKVDEI